MSNYTFSFLIQISDLLFSLAIESAIENTQRVDELRYAIAIEFRDLGMLCGDDEIGEPVWLKLFPEWQQFFNMGYESMTDFKANTPLWDEETTLLVDENPAMSW